MSVSASLGLVVRHLGGWLRGTPVFEMGYYREAELSRLACLFAHIDVDSMRGKRILEVGAGLGHLGDALRTLGLEVVSSDGRPEHVERMRDQGKEALQIDLDDPQIEDHLRGFDTVLAFGVLYHLRDPERFLRACAAAAPELLLETAVSDFADARLPMVAEPSKGWRGQDQALHALGCRPSPAWVEEIARDAGFESVRDISSGIGNWSIGVFDWEERGDGRSRDGRRNLRRMWHLASQPRGDS